jgi:hypothetical protein
VRANLAPLFCPPCTMQSHRPRVEGGTGEPQQRLRVEASFHQFGSPVSEGPGVVLEGRMSFGHGGGRGRNHKPSSGAASSILSFLERQGFEFGRKGRLELKYRPTGFRGLRHPELPLPRLPGFLPRRWSASRLKDRPI